MAAGTAEAPPPDEIHRQLTWGGVKAWAQAQGIPDDALMFQRHGGILQPHTKTLDVDYFEADEDGPAHFVVSDVWG